MQRKYGKQEVNTDLTGQSSTALEAIPLPNSGQLTIQIDYTGLGDNAIVAQVEQRIGNRWATLAEAPLEQASNTHIFNIVNLNAKSARLVILNPNTVAGTIEALHYLLT